MSLQEPRTTNEETEVSSYDREEEYRHAQQAGSEAVMVGRETLATVVRQGEQLQRAENMADDTEYKVDHTTRLLRGMTWSGWLANKFSKPLDSPEYRKTTENNKEKKTILKPLKVYASIPDSCVAASQSVQNYHLNLQVLEDCETEEQKGTCRLICNDMYRQANIKITKVLTGSKGNESNAQNSEGDEDKAKDFALQLKDDLSYLRQRQFVLQQISRGVATTTTTTKIDEKSKLFNNETSNRVVRAHMSVTDEITAQQEQHLNILSEQCQELGLLASNIGISAEQQTEIVDSLDTKNESLHFKMNIVNRKTEQLIKKKSWGTHKAVFSHYASIRHNASSCYLSLDPNNDSALVLSKVLNERCIFGIYKRRRFLGLQNKFNRKWVGQNLLGQFTCGATSFGNRQEWETGGDDDWSDTTLLIVSAGWGSGGYLLLDKTGAQQPFIGGGDFATKGQAPKWCISEFQDPR